MQHLTDSCTLNTLLHPPHTTGHPDHQQHVPEPLTHSCRASFYTSKLSHPNTTNTLPLHQHLHLQTQYTHTTPKAHSTHTLTTPKAHSRHTHSCSTQITHLQNQHSSAVSALLHSHNLLPAPARTHAVPSRHGAPARASRKERNSNTIVI